jgi:hypothetical protein
MKINDNISREKERKWRGEAYHVENSGLQSSTLDANDPTISLQ